MQPLDLNKFKSIILQESARMNLRAYSIEGETSFTLALALSAAMKKIFFDKSKGTFSDEPKMEKKLITRFVDKMRVDAMEKFNSTTVFSVIHFAANEEELTNKQYMVTLLVYLEQDFLPDFLRLMQYPYVDSDDERECKDGCGTLANIIAGQYKRELATLGYKDLMMSHFESYINSAPDGVGVPNELTHKYELSFNVDETKRLVLEIITLDMIPKWKSKTEISKKILIIDDDKVYINSVESFLKSQGFEVMVAMNGEEGIKKLKLSPHLIILDLGMPHMDGYEFARQKKRIEGNSQIPVIVMTGKESMADVFRIEGAREYLLKPFQPAALLKSIQRCI